MSNTQIIVNDIVLETFKDEGFPVKLTKQINDLRKLKTRNASFTSQISFPRTANNTSALVGLTPTFKNSKVVPISLSCNILMNGVTVLAHGRFTLSSKDERSYKGIVFFGNFDFFNLIEGDISELQWAEFDQAWEPADVDAIKATTTGIVFALASWFEPEGVKNIPAASVWNTKHDINFSGFHAYTRTIVSNIVTELGFSIDDSLVTDSLWDELALACPVTKFLTPAIIADPLLASWDNTAGSGQLVEGSFRTPADETMQFDTQIVDVDGLFNDGTDQYTSDRTAILKIILENVTGLFVNFSTQAWCEFRFIKNGTTVLGAKRITAGGAFDFSLSNVTPVISGDTIHIQIVTGGHHEGSTVFVDPVAKFTILDADGLQDPSDTLTISDWIPKIDKRMFLQWIFALFNVQVETEGSAVTLKPFDVLITSEEQDWTTNLDSSFEINEGITLPYAQINKFQYATNSALNRTDDEGIYNITNDLLKKELVLLKSGFGASDGAQRDGIYIRGTAVAEYPTYIMNSEQVAGLTTTAASEVFIIDDQGAQSSIGDYIEVGGEFRQIESRSSDTAGTVSVNFDANNTSEPWTLRRFQVQDLTQFRIARIVASQGNYDVVQGTEDVVTSIVGGKEAVFHDDLLWDNIITNSYINLLNNVANPLIIRPRFRFEVSEFAAITMLKKVYLDQYSSSFYINKILQFRSDGLCFAELIRIN